MIYKKRCPDCGRIMPMYHNAFRCYDCAIRRRKEYERRRQKKIKSENIAIQ